MLIKTLDKKTLVKYLFIIAAVGIALSFLFISNQIADDLAKEERAKIELWAEAVNTAATEDDLELNLTLKILSGNKTIPVILSDEKGQVLLSVNLDIPKGDSLHFFEKKIQAFKKQNKPIIIENENFQQYVYFGDSYTLKQLQYFPYFQIGVLTIFICVSLLAVLSTKNAEQNKVWVGLSKETAHQLGTPISAMLAWIQYLKEMDAANNTVLDEMGKDMERLQIVADRFSKIGSAPSPIILEIQNQLEKSVRYLDKRISKKVNLKLDMPDIPLYAKIIPSLFSWVIENLVKNAVDAMDGKGIIYIELATQNGKIYLDISDTGRGIAKNMFKTVFSPGFTTKERGWGLGLSLVKRIIIEYHNGRIYIKQSEINKGTTIRIELPKIIC